MLRIWVGFLVLVAVTVGVFGVRGTQTRNRPIVIFPDMQFQPRYQAQGQSAYFADGRSMRTPPIGAVPFGGGDYESDAGSPKLKAEYLAADSVYYDGKQADKFVQLAPVAFDEALMKRGQERFNIYCAVCHGGTGAGNGITTLHGFAGVANLLDDRIKKLPDGEIFHTITHGKGLMKSYARQVKPADRWAIVAYVRALERSQSVKLEDVPEPYRSELSR